MKRHVITLGGLPGSGKSTVRDILAKKLRYKTFSTGNFARTLAIDRGITIEALNEEIAHHKDLDLLIDAELERIEKEEDNIIVDSHLAFHFVPCAFKVFLETSLDESARRIFNDKESEIRKKSGDTMKTLAEAKERTKKRIENHKKRYMEHYGIEPYNTDQYDLVVDTNTRLPDEVAKIIYKSYQKWLTMDNA